MHRYFETLYIFHSFTKASQQWFSVNWWFSNSISPSVFISWHSTTRQSFSFFSMGLFIRLPSVSLWTHGFLFYSMTCNLLSLFISILKLYQIEPIGTPSCRCRFLLTLPHHSGARPYFLAQKGIPGSIYTLPSPALDLAFFLQMIQVPFRREWHLETKI